MTGAGIDDGDILVVDRSLEHTHGSIVIAAIAGEFTVKKLEQRNGKHWLVPANPDYAPVEITQEQMADIFGVVTFVIRQLQ
jgi:DNA polymerase V